MLRAPEIVRLSLAALLLATAAAPGAAVADERAEQADPEAGRLLAERYCGRCHATGQEDVSPLPEAVPLRQLRRLYPLESLAEALAEGIVTGHEAMPEFRFDPESIDHLLAWLATLESIPGEGEVPEAPQPGTRTVR